MAPKRSAPPRRPPPPPPPPPPPVASDDETASGSDSEEEEEEIAHSPPPVALKSVAPPPQKAPESEASDEDEDDEEEEEDDDEEEDEKANHVIPSATNNLPPPPPPPPTHEESETSDEEEEEEEEAVDEMPPQTKPAPNQEVEAKGAKRPSAPFQRTWSIDDEIRILEALAAHRLVHGKLPQIDVLAKALTGKLDNSGCSVSELQRKVRSLQSRCSKAAKKGALPSTDHDRRLFDLFKNVWPSATKAATKAVANGGGAGREPDEMCELYPYLAEEVTALQKAHPGVFKREFGMIDDSKARALDEKIKKQRYARMKIHIRGHDLTKEVMKTLMDLAE